jgi:hypothetical protein
MRKFTGRQLLDYATKHSPKCFAEEFHKQAGKDRERKFCQPTQHPIGIYSERFGNKRSITCIITHVAEGWYSALRTGDFHPRDFGSQERKMM